VRFPLQRAMEDLLDLLPTLGVHDGLH
jgi:hypothetical protein